MIDLMRDGRGPDGIRRVVRALAGRVQVNTRDLTRNSGNIRSAISRIIAAESHPKRLQRDAEVAGSALRVRRGHMIIQCAIKSG
jgi:hypothetical protein